MKYYDWQQEAVSTPAGDLWFIDFPDDEFNGWWMIEGRRVDNWDNRLIAVYPPPSFLDVHYPATSNGWPVYSPRLQSLLEQHVPGVVQFLPFRLQQPDGSGEVLGYAVGQILRVVDCLDRKHTKAEDNWQPVNDFGDFRVIPPYTLSSSMIGDEMLFRLHGERNIIVVREDLKDVIVNAGIVHPSSFDSRTILLS